MRLKNFLSQLQWAFYEIYAPVYMRIIRGGFWAYRARLCSKVDKSELPPLYVSFLERNCSYIGLGTKFDSIPMFPHGLHGIHISNQAIIGRGCTIMQGVTIGSNTLKGSKRCGSPVIGNNVFIGANATIIGNVHVGNNVRIGANTCVFTNIPDNHTVVSGGIKLIPHTEVLDNNFIGIEELIPQ